MAKKKLPRKKKPGTRKKAIKKKTSISKKTARSKKVKKMTTYATSVHTPSVFNSKSKHSSGVHPRTPFPPLFKRPDSKRKS
jgi:hypothetical protein